MSLIMSTPIIRTRIGALVMAMLFAAIAANPSPAQTEAPKVFELSLAGGAVADGRRVVRVTEDDAVRLDWSSDEPVELHLHGYDIKAVAAPGKPASMRFEAHATDRFPVEAHGAGGHGKTVLYLEVHPR